MKTKTLRIVFIIIGTMMMIYSGFNYVTTEKMVELGPITILSHKEHSIPFSPIIGLALIAVGFITVEKNRNKKDSTTNL
ncbi:MULTISPECIES: hypothetical protein [unclassified Flavobacterium]|uniref:hypothetical protein n=1 Tax=unclassified Flavobacterium TaxID=196869 RepID=UPI0025BB4AD3|nr:MULTISPECIES: hypothetical protein [unclassified Flavobacterium]